MPNKNIEALFGDDLCIFMQKFSLKEYDFIIQSLMKLEATLLVDERNFSKATKLGF